MLRKEQERCEDVQLEQNTYQGHHCKECKDEKSKKKTTSKEEEKKKAKKKDKSKKKPKEEL